MNPHEQFCPNTGWAGSGKVGAGNRVSHSQQEQRCGCTTCDRTFSIGRWTSNPGRRRKSSAGSTPGASAWLAFSKRDDLHDGLLRLSIDDYNLS